MVPFGAYDVMSAYRSYYNEKQEIGLATSVTSCHCGLRCVRTAFDELVFVHGLARRICKCHHLYSVSSSTLFVALKPTPPPRR